MNGLFWKVIYVLVIGAVVAGVIFVLLNFSYFSQQVVYFFDQTFVTDAQREFRRSENPVAQKPNELYIPSLEIRAPIIYIDETGEPAFQAALKKGVVHYPGTAAIGEVGNSYLFGHSSDFAFKGGEYKTVFALLPNIELGSVIEVTDEKGKVFLYKVYDKFVAEKTDVHLLGQETNGAKVLTIQTSYPIGTALKRYIVKAELKSE
jgi:LPXTG-site transpeptidase (sortase) family protein